MVHQWIRPCLLSDGSRVNRPWLGVCVPLCVGSMQTYLFNANANANAKTAFYFNLLTLSTGYDVRLSVVLLLIQFRVDLSTVSHLLQA